MKSYNHLWEVFISDINIDNSIKQALKGKRKRPSIRKYLKMSDLHDFIKEYALNFKNKNHTPVIIYDGIQRKKRIIIVPSFPEQVIHHMIVNTMIPIFMKGMYYHSYGSIPKRGPHKAKRNIEKIIREDSRNCEYFLKMDIKKYFDSIPHDIYLKKLKNIIHDDRFYKILKEVTNVVNKGLPLGFYISQWTANWYLQDLDHFIKEKLHVKYYFRYMDDMVMFDQNKEFLHYVRKEVEKYLNNNLGLRLKENWQVAKFDYISEYANHKGRPLDFMGFKFYIDKTTLRKTLLLKATRKARRTKKKFTTYASRQMISYFGWFNCTDTYWYYEDYIKPYVSFRKLKKKVSNSQLMLNRRMKNGMG